MSWLKRLLVRRFTNLIPCDHDWDQFSYGKRRCRTCEREEWLFSDPYPGIGEPKYYWKEMWPLKGRL